MQGSVSRLSRWRWSQPRCRMCCADRCTDGLRRSSPRMGLGPGHLCPDVLHSRVVRIHAVCTNVRWWIRDLALGRLSAPTSHGVMRILTFEVPPAPAIVPHRSILAGKMPSAIVRHCWRENLLCSGGIVLCANCTSAAVDLCGMRRRWDAGRSCRLVDRRRRRPLLLRRLSCRRRRRLWILLISHRGRLSSVVRGGTCTGSTRRYVRSVRR